jgi:phosphopantothenoylcysteine decarboxylase / phosphopantothenate---cysteine ligase
MRLLLGVSGGIAAYKALELVRLATKSGHAVRVVQTPTSERFVGRASFAALTGAPVLVSEFERDPARGAFPDQSPPDHDPLSHLELVRNADCYLIAPASANTLAKLAGGHADNLVTSAALAAACPVAVAPAMNDQMWANAATQANLSRLRERGIAVLDPDTGALGSKGEWGTGRLREPAELLAAVEALVPHGAPRPMDGLRVLVTAGGTREPIDSVRYVGNRSSGRMGFALADEAARRGARVTCVAANVSLPRNPAVDYVDVQTAAELTAACAAAFGEADLLLMAAAVADYRPARPAADKIKKGAAARLDLELERTDDVLAGLAAQRRPGQVLVGFAAEHGASGLEHARGKLRDKGLDAVVLNDVSRGDVGFDVAENEVTIVTAAGDAHVPRASKAEVAGAVLDAVGDLLTPEEYNSKDGVPGAPGPRGAG